MLRVLKNRFRSTPGHNTCRWLSTRARRPPREMLSFKTLIESLLQNSRRVILQIEKPVFRSFKQKCSARSSKLNQGQTDCRLARPVDLHPSPGSGLVRRFFHNVLRRVTRPDWQAASRSTNFSRLLGNASPYFAWVGISLASLPHDANTQMQHDEIETVCGDIREAISRAGWIHNPNYWTSPRKNKSAPESVSIKDFDLGPVIGKGCNAVVYAAKNASHAFDEDTLLTESTSLFPPPNPTLAPTRKRSFFKGSFMRKKDDRKRKAAEQDNASEVFEDSLKEYPLAIKMMFNYDAESNFGAIFKSMHREVLPANYLQISQGFMEWKKRYCGDFRMPPHSNIVRMPCVFVDTVPLLPESTSLYPNALPKRLHTQGYGRNMSMFIVMQRYNCTLAEYLSKFSPDTKTALLILTQLLEAVLHLANCSVVHRDLKLDNILLCLSEGANYPKVVLTDFGCCLADQSANLSVPFPSDECDPRLGNAALMAPEVKNASPGMLRSVDYSKNDLWAVGAVSFELFGIPIPFYMNNGTQLDSGSYNQSQLPKLPKTLPQAIRHLLYAILQPNPRDRPDTVVAATICQLYLWAPAKWTCRTAQMPSYKEVGEMVATNLLGRLESIASVPTANTHLRMDGFH